MPADTTPIERDEIFAIVRDRLADILEIEPSGISEGQSFVDDLDADSLALIELVEALECDPRRHAVFTGMRHLLEVRREQPAFSPFGTQRVEALDDRVFAVRRGAGTADELLCVTNVTGSPVRLPGVGGYDVLSGTSVDSLELAAYGFVWLRPS